VRARDARPRWAAIALVALAAALLAPTAPAQAQTFTVSNLADTGVSGDGSLRGEVKAANANPGADTIAFASGLSGLIVINGSGFVIEDSVDIEGPGPDQITVEQNASNHRVFQIKLAEPGAVAIAGLTLRGGNTSGSGGDIQNAPGPTSTLTVSNCRVIYGFAEQQGGGIDSFGQPLIVRSSVVSENEAMGGGGVRAGGSGTPFTIEDSTIAGNIAGVDGGGLAGEVEASGHSAVSGSTFAGNLAPFGGGGAFFSVGAGATVTVADSTFTRNSSTELGGGLEIVSGAESTTIEDSTIAGNVAGGPHLGSGSQVAGISGFGAPQKLLDSIVAANSGTGPGPEISGKWATAFSLIGNPAGATLAESIPGSDLIGVDPQLGPLQDNGGPTATMALPPTSPAVNKGGGSLGRDQRGLARPVLYPGVPNSSAPGANGADVGAYELQAPPVTLAPSVTPAPSPSQPAPVHKRKRKHPPRVRVSCPRSAAPGGCHVTLQVFSARPRRTTGAGGRPRPRKPVAESRVARANLRAGSSAEPPLIPKPGFAARLEAANRLLVREVLKIAGRAKVSYRRMKVVR